MSGMGGPSWPDSPSEVKEHADEYLTLTLKILSMRIPGVIRQAGVDSVEAETSVRAPVRQSW